MGEDIRISISLLVPVINDTYIGIFDRKSLIRRNEKIIAALGGASILYNRQLLIERYAAFAFEGEDARFTIPKKCYLFFLMTLDI